ncbi:MAG TPA: SRPBCC family protein [Tepidisphaeraceae bacterium]|jgi:uncharacterized membrane protein
MTLQNYSGGEETVDQSLATDGPVPHSGPAETLPAVRATNISDGERAVSVAAGAIVALMGLKRGTLPGFIAAGVGGALIYRGVTGHCHAYQALGVSTANEDDALDEHGIHIAQSFIINRPVAELYAFWRDFENLPRIMTHLESVQVLDGDGTHSRWVAKGHGLLSKRLEWDARITADEPNRVIAWRSLPGASVQNDGRITFGQALGDRGSQVHVSMSYVPPGGRVVHWVASLLGQNPKRVVREDLRNFKRLMELGELPTINGQSQGGCGGQGKRTQESDWKPLFT